MSLKLLGAGFGRTGTTSTKRALEMLGWGPCHHMSEIRANSALLPDWVAAARGAQMDWKIVFRDYKSQLDWPGARYWRALTDYFPDAKVILNYRDPQDWYESLRKTILPSAALGREVDPNPHTRAMAEMVYETVHQQIFQGRIDDRDFAINVYLNHVSEVQATIPGSRLLTYDVNDGWEPLCEFLGEAIPTESFPHDNTRQEFIEKRSFLKHLEVPT